MYEQNADKPSRLRSLGCCHRQLMQRLEVILIHVAVYARGPDEACNGKRTELHWFVDCFLAGLLVLEGQFVVLHPLSIGIYWHIGLIEFKFLSLQINSAYGLGDCKRLQSTCPSSWTAPTPAPHSSTDSSRIRLPLDSTERRQDAERCLAVTHAAAVMSAEALLEQPDLFVETEALAGRVDGSDGSTDARVRRMEESVEELSCEVGLFRKWIATC